MSFLIFTDRKRNPIDIGEVQELSEEKADGSERTVMVLARFQIFKTIQQDRGQLSISCDSEEEKRKISGILQESEFDVAVE